MSYAVMMVHVGEQARSDARLRLAAELADRFNAKLIGIAAEEQRPLFVTDGFVADGELAAREYQEIVGRLKQAEEYFRTTVSETKQQPEWRGFVENPVTALAAEMRAADLAVIGRSNGGDWYRSLDPAAALLRLGRPALVVPDGISTLEAKNVVIAWKDTRECRRAVQDALPFLHEARSVHIVEVYSDEQAADAGKCLQDVTRYLVRHRIEAHAEALPQTETTVAQELVHAAQAKGADLIVAGAYGHSRFGEWVFGGVTHDLLDASPICCLMSH